VCQRVERLPEVCFAGLQDNGISQLSPRLIQTEQQREAATAGPQELDLPDVQPDVQQHGGVGPLVVCQRVEHLPEVCFAGLQDNGIFQKLSPRLIQTEQQHEAAGLTGRAEKPNRPNELEEHDVAMMALTKHGAQQYEDEDEVAGGWLAVVADGGRRLTAAAAAGG
jgi:hypothetical protein